MSDPSFQAMATVTASTKRPATISAAGKRAESPATVISSLKCFPLDPVSQRDAETIRRKYTNAPIDLRVTYCELGLDIQDGDILIVNTKEYPIQSVSEYEWFGSTFQKLIVEKKKAE